ncbi:autoinducer-binding transcriptional regulator TraR [Sinorhizobium saheli]|uniref:Transcriptional regulator TraR n=1 Tax=Sinorhizobium saheli TaxID=36856 RepID=A0A178XYW6_SINSA|nr:transcriptional regulator TraR [Sinorhizobium saheli]MQW86363.1 transcriptional regulator TraR [Sinorhizobium saheli]OAP39665.1 transcriptional regulator TraR [Sinorhizobium saheli]
MRQWLDRLTDLAAIPGDERIVKHGLANFTEEMGFVGYAYVNILSSHVHIVSNYGPEWQSEYTEQHYFEIDPVVRRARALKGAFTWSGERERSQLTKEERSFYAHAADFGIRSGVTIPIRAAHGTLAMFTLASGKPESELRQGLDPLAAAAAVGQLHARISFTDLAPTVPQPEFFDSKAATYLYWLSEGKTKQEVADLENVTYGSVRSKLRLAEKHLKTGNTMHLVATAIRKGLI